LARQEAIISFARAVFAAGGTVAVPLDVDVAPLLGTVALDYLEPRAAEIRGEPPVPRVTIMETEHRSEPARQLLAPLAERGAVRVVDREGEAVVLRASIEPQLPGRSEVARQRVTERMVGLLRPRFAVLINPGRQLIEEDVRVLRRGDVRVPTFNFGTEDGDAATVELLSELDVYDPSAQLLEGTTRSPWTDEEDAPQYGRHPVPPYAYLMQRLIAQRLNA
jgi:hypothetical protein